MSQRRSAFTLVEVLVVIAIVGILAGLLLPAVMQSTKHARLRQCQSQMKQLSQACLTFEGIRGRFPGSRERVANQNGDFGATWIMSILPYMDQAALSDRWRDPQANWVLPPTANGSPVYNRQLAVTIATVRCPSDTTLDAMVFDMPVQGPTGTSPVSPDTSYVASGGFLPIPGFDPGRYGASNSRIAAMNRNNGIFHDLWRSPKSKISLDMIRDGASNTALLSENLQANFWFFNGDLDEDGSGLPHRNRFSTMFYFPYVSDHPMVNNPNGAPTQSLRTAMRINGDKNSVPMVFDPGMFKARPSSQHGNFVNMAFADGSVRLIQEDIEFHVYTALITPRGSKADVPYRE